MSNTDGDRAESSAGTPQWIVKCLDCGFEKKCGGGGGISPEESAKRTKAGHIGGGSVYYSVDGPCENVLAVPVGEFEEVRSYLEELSNRYDIEDFYVGGKEKWLNDRLKKTFLQEGGPGEEKFTLEDLLIEEDNDAE